MVSGKACLIKQAQKFFMLVKMTEKVSYDVWIFLYLPAAGDRVHE